MPAISSDTNFNGANPQDLSFVNFGANSNILYSYGMNQGDIGPKSSADTLCNSAKPSGTSQGYAFASFSITEEIRDLPTTANLNTNLNVRSTFGRLVATNWTDLLDGNISMSLQSAGVAIQPWWSFSDSNGIFHINNCSNGTSNSNSVQGKTGGITSSSGGWINGTTRNCDNSRLLLCIAKP
tara:strand:+ start:11 stop:556 length:546 start_codon:yes stop_codon:yes gene_type:complete